MRKKLSILNIVFLALIWADVFYVLSLEWFHNDQYSYGFFIPFIGLYLIYLRWLDRPAPKIDTGKHTQSILFAGIGLGLFLIYGLKILLEANPEWRMAFWAYGLIAYGLTLLFIHHWGGKPWLFHFILPVSMFLFAIPWPVRIEQSIVLGLMNMVTFTTVETINLCGISAIQKGNIIHLAMGESVGVEEACSGVRSLQSSIMLGFFIGELFRFNFKWRSTLLTTGIIISITLNIARALLLSVGTHRQGTDYVANWHDTFGMIASLSTLGLLFIFALIIKTKFKNPLYLQPKNTVYGLDFQRVISLRAFLISTGLFLFSFAAVEGWYLRYAPDPKTRVRTNFDLGDSYSFLEKREIPNKIQALLRYSKGINSRGLDSNQIQWDVYYFYWGSGKISSLAGVHRPEVCFPYSGFQRVAKDEPLLWKKDKLKLNVEVSTFKKFEREIHVFFAVWDEHPDLDIAMGRTQQDRIKSAIKGKRITARHEILFSIAGTSLQEARRLADSFLGNTLEIVD